MTNEAQNGQLPLNPLSASEVSESGQRESQTPGRMAWRQLKRNRVAMLRRHRALLSLCLCHLWPIFLRPIPTATSVAPLYYHPPTSLVWHDTAGHFSLVPSVYPTHRDLMSGAYVADVNRPAPVHFFVQGYPYRLIGLIPLKVHLFGAEARAPVFCAWHR